MSLYRYQGSKVWTMDFMFQGQRIRESTGTRSKTLAQKIEDKRRRGLEEGSAGIRKRERPRLFSVAADDWLEMKQSSLAPKTVLIEKTNLAHLKPEVGGKLVCDIDAHDIAKYRDLRLREGASPKTINLELGTLRAVVGPRTWGNLRADTREKGMKIMLPTREDVGRAITAEEERALLRACSQSRSRCLLPFVTLAIETGARFNVIRTLQWGSVNFSNRCIQFGKDKTPSGTGRIIPLNPRAMATLTFWASYFPDRKPEHYVFPKERYGAAGNKFEPRAYDTDPETPIGDVKEGWEAAKLRAAKILKGVPERKEEANSGLDGEVNSEEKKIEPLTCRFHDLRHTAVSRMLNAGVPIAKVAKIVGWSPATMVRMATRYGHFALEELRGAVESISRPEIQAGSPVNSPVSESAPPTLRTN